MIQMSVHLMNPTPGLRVDHIDGNKLNCRRANLRTCTHAENIRNRKKHKNGSSRFKGVHNDGVRWRARIKLNGKAKSLGTYRTEIEAALAYDRAAREMFGEFARPNFP